ncbi:MAG: hypothetical protein ACOVOQ_00075 [Flavobacterium sp.]
MKIKSLQFYDYRVFYSTKEEDKKDYLIEVDAKNLLLYGENGSGKTSLFKGLNDIIYQKDFIPHFQTPLLNAGYVEIVFDDNSTDRFDAAGATASKAELINISKLNSFLSYKELLRTHLQDDDEINFFDLIVNDILKEHTLGTLGQLKVAWDTLTSKNLESVRVTIEESVGKEITAEEAAEQIEKLYADYNVEVTKFSDELDLLLSTINTDIKEIIAYFQQGIEIEFELTPLTTANLSNPELKAKVKYATTGLNSFHLFLNEAKLSAIAISIYLTALKSNPTQNAIKFLFLDDVFLGLDLSNRLPLLDILKEKFSDWQIFLTTYDRHWFEVAKQHLNSDWKAIEMYATSVEGKLFDKPLIIQSDDYFLKANNYFSAGDYPASLNYLRKELEFQIKTRLPEESTRHYEGRPHQLAHYWDLLVERYNRNNQGALITDKIKEELKLARFSLLNPQSHDNLSSPVYKYELQRAIDLIKEIQVIPIIRGVTLLASGMELVFKHPSIDYTIKLELLQDWKLDIVGAVKTHDYPNCKIKHWQFNNQPFFNLVRNVAGTEPQNPIEDRLDIIRNNVIGYALLQPLTEDIFNTNTKFETIWTIKELIEKSDNPKRDNWFCRIFRK